jgi:hypothetical protein
MSLSDWKLLDAPHRIADVDGSNVATGSFKKYAQYEHRETAEGGTVTVTTAYLDLPGVAAADLVTASVTPPTAPDNIAFDQTDPDTFSLIDKTGLAEGTTPTITASGSTSKAVLDLTSAFDPATGTVRLTVVEGLIADSADLNPGEDFVIEIKDAEDTTLGSLSIMDAVASLDVSGLNDGSLTFIAQITDDAGNVAFRDSVVEHTPTSDNEDIFTAVNLILDQTEAQITSSSAEDEDSDRVLSKDQPTITLSVNEEVSAVHLVYVGKVETDSPGPNPHSDLVSLDFVNDYSGQDSAITVTLTEAQKNCRRLLGDRGDRCGGQPHPAPTEHSRPNRAI